MWNGQLWAGIQKDRTFAQQKSNLSPHQLRRLAAKRRAAFERMRQKQPTQRR